MHTKLANILVGIIGLIIGALSFYLVSPFLISSEWWPGHTAHNHSDEEYHIHTDFLVVVEDEIIDLSGNEHMSTATQTLHKHVHLHDNDDNLLHVHHENISFVEFLASLNITLTDSCLTLPSKEVRCTDGTTQLMLYVNNEQFTGPLSSYTPKDLDRVLLYLGTNGNTAEAIFGPKITDEACIFSGSCPERGLPPPESCGLTCEL